MKDQDNIQPEQQQPSKDVEDTMAKPETAVPDTENSANEQSDSTGLDALQAELSKYKELGLRIQAEADNQRKRMQRDFDKRRQFALESFMRDLISVRDSLERGLDATVSSDAAEKVTPLREGMQMTLKQLDKVLADNGLSVLDPQGEVFNPELHEAATMQPSDQQEPNTVLQVIQKGYCLHDRLLRPAMVIVAKAAD